VCGLEQGGEEWAIMSAATGQNYKFLEGTFSMAVVFLVMMFAWLGAFLFKRGRRSRYIRLNGEEVSSSHHCLQSNFNLTFSVSQKL
jgi:hypothetical protein